MSAELTVRRLRDELVRLREQISRESRTTANKRKAAADARAQAGRSKSASTVQSKLREADRHEAAALAAERNRADLEKKVATKEKALATALASWEREQAAAQKKAIDGIRRQADEAARRFNGAPAANGHSLVEEFHREEESAFDVFLSHASEDKDDIARPLADALLARGVNVWFDELNIRVGQSIRRQIEAGIRDARFGLVVISEHFMSKQWTQAELDALWGKKLAADDDSLLPIWHKVTYDEVQRGLPLLAGLHALNTSTMQIDKMADLPADTVKA